jgi:hypothetical protein
LDFVAGTLVLWVGSKKTYSIRERKMTAKEQAEMREEMKLTRETLIEFKAWAKDEVLEHKKILKGNGQPGVVDRLTIVETNQKANEKSKALLVSYCAVAVSLIPAVCQYLPSILTLIK